MQYHTIASYQDYLDLCDYIEQDNPSVVEIGTDYFVTDKEHFTVEYDTKAIMEDITDYVLNGISKEPKEEPKQQKTVKKKVNENQIIEFKPLSQLKVEDCEFNIY